MSAHTIFDNAPIGSLVAWSDGVSRLPDRHRKKLSAWQSNNSQGRLIQKQGARGVGNITLSASFTLQKADVGAGGVIAILVHRCFSLESKLQFKILDRPAVGSVRVFSHAGPGAELVHLAAHRAAGEEWLSRHGYPGAVLEEITADEIGADVVEGRAA